MSSRFTHLDVLRGIGRNLLARFLDSFATDLAAKKISLPDPNLPDEQFFRAVGAIFASPEPLPEPLVEALSAIEEIATPEGQQQIKSALANAPFRIHFDPESSPYQIAVHIWLAVPELLVLTQTYTLEPLRTDGPDVLDAAGIPAIKKITLRELGIASNNAFNEITIHKAEDLFRCVAAEGVHRNAIPKAGTLTYATFDLEFDDSPEPRAVEIRPPHTLKLSRPSDAQLVKPWLSKKRFSAQRHNWGGIGTQDAKGGGIAAQDGKSVANP